MIGEPGRLLQHPDRERLPPHPGNRGERRRFVSGHLRVLPPAVPVDRGIEPCRRVEVRPGRIDPDLALRLLSGHGRDRGVVATRPDNVDLPHCPAVPTHFGGRDLPDQVERDDTRASLLGSLICGGVRSLWTEKGCWQFRVNRCWCTLHHGGCRLSCLCAAYCFLVLWWYQSDFIAGDSLLPGEFCNGVCDVVERVISLIRCSCAGGSVLRRARFDRPASEQVSARKERWAWGIISENRAW